MRRQAASVVLHVHLDKRSLQDTAREQFLCCSSLGEECRQVPGSGSWQSASRQRSCTLRGAVSHAAYSSGNMFVCEAVLLTAWVEKQPISELSTCAGK